MEATTFSALGEPSRLQIVELLRTRPHSVGEIAEELGIRQPQVSKHLRVLATAGIVVAERDARRRIYRLDPEPFEEIGEWVDSFEQIWALRLESLGDYLDSTDNEGNDDGDDDDS